MKRLITLIAVCSIILSLLIYLIFKDSDENLSTAVNLPDKNPSKTTASTRGEKTLVNEKTVKLFNFTSQPYTQVKEYTLIQLAERYQFPREIYDKKSKYLIHTDDAENVIKITKHAEYYLSISKRNDLQDELENSGYFITKLGSDFYNLNNRDGMLAIIEALCEPTLIDYQFPGNDDDKTEVELIPVKIVIKNPKIKLLVNVEMEGILINKKQAYISQETREDVVYRALNLDDCIASYWNLTPVYLANAPNNDPKRSAYVFDSSEQIGIFLPELRFNK